MKHDTNNNKNLSLLSLIILCFALLGQCKAHFQHLHNRHAYPPEVNQQPFSDTPGHETLEISPTPGPSHGHHHHHGHDKDHDHNNGHGQSPLSSSISDMVHGTLRGHALTMPEQVPYSRHAYPPEVSHRSFSDTPGHKEASGNSPTPTPAQSHDHHHGDNDKDDDHSQPSFSDIVRGALRGNALTMPKQVLHGRQAYEVSQQSFSDTPGLEASESNPTPASASAPSPSHDHHHGHGHGHGPSSSAPLSSSSFSDTFRRGHPLTMQEHVIGSQNNKHNHALKQICGNTDYPKVCLSTISPMMNGHDFDIMKVLQAAIEACAEQIKMTMEKIEKKHSSMSPEKMGTALFLDCRQHYQNALANLQRARDAIPSRDLGTVTIMLSAVMADVSTCDSGFEDYKVSALKVDTEGMIGNMASNCLAIAHLIPH